MEAVMDLRPPIRVSHSFVQQLVAPPEEVFELLCPVRERDWVEGWAPKVVWTQSGLVAVNLVASCGAKRHPSYCGLHLHRIGA